MIEVIFRDGTRRVYDAEFAMTPPGVFILYRGPVGAREAVLSVPTSLIKNYEHVDQLTPKQIAAKLLAAMDSTPHGSRKIALLAEVEYGDGQLIIAILKKLRDVGKVQFANGKWSRV